MVTLLHTMKKRGKTLGLATLCGGGGVSLACVLEMI
jgi:acetyl-CoA C-acetyltransferase